MNGKKSAQVGCVLLLAFSLAACAVMPTSGPSAKVVRKIAYNDDKLRGVVVKKVDANLTRALQQKKRVPLFSEYFDTSKKPQYRVKTGDFLEIIIWEAPPNALFGGPGLDVKTGSITSAKAETLPEQMVMEDGKITVPFAGNVYVNGYTTRQIEKAIEKKLTGQANRPQVLVRFAQNNTSNVIVVGDLRKNVRMPITPKGERVLDAIAAGGGAVHDLKYTAVQLSRGAKTAILPLETIIRQPAENIPLLAGDVVAALYQPKKFSVMGAVEKNQEISFEVQGISLAQALVRAGGFNDNRTDPSGVFVFRFEKNPSTSSANALTVAADGTVPTVYEIDFSTPTSFFVTQNFMIEHGDVLYVANAQTAQLQKFLGLVGGVVAPVTDTLTLVRTMDLLNQ